MKNKKQFKIIRYGVLVLTTVFYLFLSGFISEHAICPIGGFEFFFTRLFAQGFSIAGLFSGMVITFFFMSVLSLILRRVYCGYICPMGALQEFSNLLGKKLLPKKLKNLRIPKKIDKILKFLKYFVLASYVVVTAYLGSNWMVSFDPFIAMRNVGSLVGLETLARHLPFSLAFFVAVILFAFFFGRLFCRYICPAGAWYSILAKVSPSKIVKDNSKCVNCGLCSKACPMQIDVAKMDKVTSGECINCRACEIACPKDALSFKVINAEVPAVAVPFTAAAVFAGGITSANYMFMTRGFFGKAENELQENQKILTLQNQETDTNILREPNQNKKRVRFACGDCTACGFCFRS